jgi:dTDP-4-dehydrorhamnose 3,5-epimerase
VKRERETQTAQCAELAWLLAASPTCGRFVGVELSDDNHRQLWIPPGYAHGFCVLSDVADVQYKCTEFYFPEDEGGLIWNDPDVKIPWPIEAPMLSATDRGNPMLRKLVGRG